MYNRLKFQNDQSWNHGLIRTLNVKFVRKKFEMNNTYIEIQPRFQVYCGTVCFRRGVFTYIAVYKYFSVMSIVDKARAITVVDN